MAKISALVDLATPIVSGCNSRRGLIQQVHQEMYQPLMQVHKDTSGPSPSFKIPESVNNSESCYYY